MALGTSNNKIFLSVADGKIVQRAKKETPGATPRTKKDGGIVYELRYAYISGILTNIGTRTSQYNGQDIKEWVFDITDGNDSYQVQIGYDSRYATSLLYALANPEVDLSQPITITPWMKVVGDKKKMSCYLKQGEKSINWYFTKENPNGLPDLKQITFKGKQTWDSYDRMQFLEQYVTNQIKPRLKAPAYAPIDNEPAFVPDTQPSSGTFDPNTDAWPDSDDDLPF